MAFPNFENKRFLVVEDDEMSFLYINQLLMISKAIYRREKNGKDAINEFTNNNYDLVLMDIQLPDMDGMEVTRKIRSINPVIPVIAQTASRSSEEKEKIMDAGCTDILMKPFSIDEFFKTLQRTFPE